MQVIQLSTKQLIKLLTQQQYYYREELEKRMLLAFHV
jgi:hypothetical protein